MNVKPTSEVDPPEPRGDAAAEPPFAAEDEFIARRKRRTGRLWLLLLVFVPAGLLTLLALDLGGDFFLEWKEQPELAKLYAEIAELRGTIIAEIETDPGEHAWRSLRKTVELKTKTIQSRLSKLRAQSRERAQLTGALTAVRSAVRQPTPQAALPKLKDAKKKLDAVKNQLKL